MVAEVMVNEENKLEKQLEDLNRKKKELSEKRKRFQAKRLEGIGRIAVEANIDDLDPVVILGALLSISEKKNDESTLSKWKNTAEKFRSTSTKEQQKLIVKAGQNPAKEVRKIMKDLSFKWNSFRNEFYGQGKPDQLKTLLKDLDCKIDLVNTN